MRTLTLTLALALASAALLVGFDQAAAQDLQLRAGALTAASLAGRGDDTLATTSFEVTAVRSRLQAPDAPLPRLDGRPGDELAGVNYRLWMTRGRADVGFGLGSLGYLLPSADGPRSLVGAVPTLTLGMRVRVSDQHLLFADATGARGLGANPAATHVATKLGMEWKPARSTVGFDHGALGVQLDSGYRLSLKSRRGGPVLYLRNTF